MTLPFFLTYIVSSLLLSLVFCLILKKHTFLSIPLAIVIDLLVYWDDFVYYESRNLFLFFTLSQIIIIFLITLALRKIINSRHS